MELPKVSPIGTGRNNFISRVVTFSLTGAIGLAVVGAVEGWGAFTVFRAIEQRLFPHYGAMVMTAASSQMPVVLAVVGFLIGGLGAAMFGAGRRAQEETRATLTSILKNSLIGSVLGVLLGGFGGLALGRLQDQTPTSLFITFFAAVCFSFLIGTIGGLIVSTRRKSRTD